MAIKEYSAERELLDENREMASAGSPLMQEAIEVMRKYLAGDTETVSYRHRFQDFVSRYDAGER